MKNRVVAATVFVAASAAMYWLHFSGWWPVRLSAGHTLWGFLGTVCAVMAFRHAAAILIRDYVRWRGGPEGESRMLTGFVGVMCWLAILGAFLYSLGVLATIGGVAAGFAGLLLGWSLQAPVSGIAAWVLVTLKRPFRIGDRVLFPSLGLNGDVKSVGLMYTTLDQVGGAIGSEEAIGRDILIPNAMLFQQVAINYTPKAEAAFFLDEVVIRITYDSDWDAAEKILLDAAREVTANVIRETGHEPYIRSDMWDYGILMRLRYMTMAKDRPRITHEIVRHIFKAVQRDLRVDMAIPFVYSFRKSTDGVMRGDLPEGVPTIKEVPLGLIEAGCLALAAEPEQAAEVEKLVANIRERGLLQPIVVAPLPDGRYRIVAGHRRFLACHQLGWKSIPAVIRTEAGPPPPPQKLNRTAP
ncbi:MAG TPA: mechanosensitive ion channel [Planctomycetota bacterium]|nr:mechanosensitive ion channel [Planctomycetota bacterium]HRR82545.1 mechanosensitive ion channel [Planctomycetota bacterium]HRT95244.1 mechanosensitive ion channel [Planctomycetota bacterium]